MRKMPRRDFLKGAAIATIAAAPVTAQPAASVAVVIEPAERAPAHWAAAELLAALAERGVIAAQYDSIAQVPEDSFPIVAEVGKGRVPDAPESLALVPAGQGGRPVLLASGSDTRGLTYALLELADRVRLAERPREALDIRQPVAAQPANAVRSVARLFTSEVEDKVWFYDREMWPAYLTMLASERFNRFHLAFGIGYDFLREVTDSYFLFPYPFFLSVPGYDVRVVELPHAERDLNLEMLNFIGGQAAERGLEFQLGLWMHGYQWANSPNANYTIAGVSAENHAAYCRDALAALLRACPGITGVTFRIHGESGVAEGSYPFWKTVFDGVGLAGRRVEIDLHAKGLDQRMIDAALSTGMPVKASPKFWAEHMGMPYHQADIREVEVPRAGHADQGLMALSSGSRSFTRYGYADLLREDRRYAVWHRIWPGTQRLLLWGDPLTAAACSRAFRFCGSAGVDIMEPLSFMGRRGSGIKGSRCAYADASLKPRWDWQKYLYTYRVWGRLLYDPEADPDGWRRYLRKQYQSAAADAEAALAAASRVLPTLTTAHGPSAANNTFWPEIYTNQPIVDARRNNPYTDTPAPKVFGNVSPFDPQLFSTINGFAAELRQGEFSGKYSPLEVAGWLQGFSETAVARISQAEAKAPRTTDFRRLAIDVRIQAGLGRFFAEKLRAGVFYAVDNRAEALKAYRRARDAWAQLAGLAKPVYAADITAGELPWLRGHWQDRLAAIDADIADLAAQPSGPAPSLPLFRRTSTCRHTPAARFTPGRPLDLEIAVDGAAASVRLHYRHVNQAERWQSAEMKLQGGLHQGAIPAAYTNSPYPLQYYFEARVDAKDATLYPGFAQDLANQPYFVVRSGPG